MDADEKDVVVSLMESSAYKMFLKFKDKDPISPSDVFEKVKDLTKNNSKKMHDTIGRIGELLVGSRNNPMLSFAFAMGWYYRKAVESLEKKHGPCEIQYSSEELTKPELIKYIGNVIRRDAAKLQEFADELARGDLPEDFFPDEEK